MKNPAILLFVSTLITLGQIRCATEAKNDSSYEECSLKRVWMTEPSSKRLRCVIYRVIKLIPM